MLLDAYCYDIGPSGRRLFDMLHDRGSSAYLMVKSAVESANKFWKVEENRELLQKHCKKTVDEIKSNRH